MRIISYIGLFCVFAIALSFAILNADTVTLNLYLRQFHLALSLLLVVALAIGIILGILIMVKSVLRLKSENSRLKSKIKEHEKHPNRLGSVYDSLG